MAGPDSSEPTGIFTPRLLEADVPENLASVFAQARRIASGDDPLFPSGQKRVAIVTPGRAIVSIPAPPEDLVTAKTLRALKTLFGPVNRDIAIISYTKLDSLMGGDHGRFTAESAQACIPSLPRLMMLAAAGHKLVVFEGHPAALEPALRDTDVLLIDSGMLPFLPADSVRVAARVMRPGARYFVCGREKQSLLEIVPAAQSPGWLYKEPDGEDSYANCLLTMLGKRPGSSASLTTDGAVPDLRTLTANPDELEWVAALPFQYDRLDASVVIQTILLYAGVCDDRPRLLPWLQRHYVLNARLAQQGGGTSFCPFRLTVSGFGSRKRLAILREDF
jgi:hypothetical protein